MVGLVCVCCGLVFGCVLIVCGLWLFVRDVNSVVLQRFFVCVVYVIVLRLAIGLVIWVWSLFVVCDLCCLLWVGCGLLFSWFR